MEHMDHTQMDHSGHMDHGDGGGMEDMCSMSVRSLSLHSTIDML